MAGNKNESVVIATFASHVDADRAVEALKGWDKASEEIKLGAIGTIAKEGDKVQTHVGRQTGKGLWVGAVIGLIAAMFPAVTIVGGVVGGAALGTITGAFFKKPLNLNKEEVGKIAAELEGGKVAVVVTCDPDEVAPTSQQLASYGGTVRDYTVPQEVVAEAAKAVEGGTDSKSISA